MNEVLVINFLSAKLIKLLFERRDQLAKNSQF